MPVSDRETHAALLLLRQRLPDRAGNGIYFSAVVGIPMADVTDGGEDSRNAGCVRRAPVQRPGVTNEYVADFERHGLQLPFNRVELPKSFASRKAMSSGCDLDRAVRGCDWNQPEADRQHIGRQ